MSRTRHPRGYDRNEGISAYAKSHNRRTKARHVKEMRRDPDGVSFTPWRKSFRGWAH